MLIRLFDRMVDLGFDLEGCVYFFVYGGEAAVGWHLCEICSFGKS